MVFVILNYLSNGILSVWCVVLLNHDSFLFQLFTCGTYALLLAVIYIYFEILSCATTLTLLNTNQLM